MKIQNRFLRLLVGYLILAAAIAGVTEMVIIINYISKRFDFDLFRIIFHLSKLCKGYENWIMGGFFLILLMIILWFSMVVANRIGNELFKPKEDKK